MERGREALINLKHSVAGSHAHPAMESAPQPSAKKKGEPLSYKKTDEFTIRKTSKSLKCTCTYLTTANSFCCCLWKM